MKTYIEDYLTKNPNLTDEETRNNLCVKEQGYNPKVTFCNNSCCSDCWDQRMPLTYSDVCRIISKWPKWKQEIKL